MLEPLNKRKDVLEDEPPARKKVNRTQTCPDKTHTYTEVGHDP